MARPRARSRGLLALLLVVLLGGGAAALLLRQQGDPARASGVGAVEPVVVGDDLVDRRTGDDWVPRGLTWSSFEHACAQGWGMSSLDALGEGAEDEQARLLASWGVDTVRLPLNQDCWLGTRRAPVSDRYATRTPAGYRDAVEAFVDALNRHGMVAVLDLHSRKRMSSLEFGSMAMPDSESLTFWTSVATRFADHRSVMFDAFSEPQDRYDAVGRRVFELTWRCWRDGGCAPPVEDASQPTDGRTTYPAQGMRAVVDAIRRGGAEQPVLLSGLDGGNDLSRWAEFAPDDDQLVAAFHADDDGACDRACWDDVVAPLADEVPVLTSELGAADPAGDGRGFVTDYLRWADRRGIGSLLWVWADQPGDPMALVTDVRGEPTDWGRLARSWLADGVAGPPAQAPPSRPADRPGRAPQGR